MAQKPQPASINSIEFDALISYGRNYEAQAPEYPVEEGYSVRSEERRVGKECAA